MNKRFRIRINRAHLALVHDVVMSALAFALAVFVRVGPDGIDKFVDPMLMGSAALAGVSALVFRTTGLYRGIWRYASFEDILAIVKAASIAVPLTALLLFLVSRGDSVPRSSLVLSWVLQILLLAGPRLLYRVAKDRHLGNLLRRMPDAHRIPVLLIGANDQAELFIREMARNAGASYRVVGIIDEKTRRIGQSIRNVPILGSIPDVPEVVAELARRNSAPQRMIVTRDRVSAEQIGALLEIGEQIALPIARLPRLTDFQGEDGVMLGRLEPRPIAIEDLLNRPQAALDRTPVESLVRGRRVLVTGAGGTIGGELTRQLAALGPSHLALLDSSEFALYTIDLEIGENFPGVSRSVHLGSVRDRKRLGEVFTDVAPDLVFHAAALKHVPMVEHNPDEGILTNVIGTRYVADLAREHGVAAMVMISTDKAVNPTNVMGATKRLAESWCQALDVAERRRNTQAGPGAARQGTRYVTVRFGNVLGSTGSVVPLFQRQLAQGGPLTVTHPEITRYFMTVREAVELVLQASALHGSEQAAADQADIAGGIFVLDMGEPIKIADLARQMIRLAGLRPERDVKIAFTGLRPGEKLYEELFHDKELLVETAARGVQLAHPRASDAAFLARAIDELEAASRARRTRDALDLLGRLVPEFAASVPPQEPVTEPQAAVGARRHAPGE